jgi:hypothetical protein
MAGMVNDWAHDSAACIPYVRWRAEHIQMAGMKSLSVGIVDDDFLYEIPSMPQRSHALKRSALDGSVPFRRFVWSRI